MMHGFFITMGGFHLFKHSSEETSNNGWRILQEDDKPLHPLGESDLVQCDSYGSFTMPTTAEIKDRGKSDWLTKSLVLLWTSWFIMQCIAQAIEYLPVTHLKIVMLAYAAMNFLIYFFWWNKPLNVNWPVQVFQKPDPRGTQLRVTEPISKVQKLTWEAISNDFESIFRFIVGGQDEDVDLSCKDRVPGFWANSIGSSGNIELIADFIVLGVDVCFGAIHCITWIFSFPTHTELLMWCILSIAITAVPI